VFHGARSEWPCSLARPSCGASSWRQFHHPIVALVGDIEVAGAVHRHTGGAVEAGVRDGTALRVDSYGVYWAGGRASGAAGGGWVNRRQPTGDLPTYEVGVVLLDVVPTRSERHRRARLEPGA
jgi:hypothetical protein